jgi:hypothetical protein
MTPGALELILVFFGGGEEERPWTAESTLVRGSDMMAVGVVQVLGSTCGIGALVLGQEL